MSDVRISTYANLVQTEFRDTFTMAPLSPTPLRAMAMNLEIQPGGNTFREFVTPFVRGTSSNLATIRARTSNTNPLTTNVDNFGQITSTVERIGYLDHTIIDSYEWARDVEHTSGIDALYNQPDRVASRLRTQFDEAYNQWQHEKVLAQAIYSNEWIVASSSTGVTNAAINALDTTFEITDAFKAYSGIAVGDIVKIGDARKPSDNTSAVETIDVVTIKTLGGDSSGAGTNSIITIETDTDEFPASRSADGDGNQGTAFEKLKVTLSAHSSGARVQIDIPQALTVLTADPIMTSINTARIRANSVGGEFVVYHTPEADAMLFGTNSSGVRTPMVANDFLGKDVLFNGELTRYRGMNLMVDSNALSRTESYSGTDLASERHYIWGFVKGMTFGYGEPLKGGGTFEQIVGTDAKLFKFSFLEISGAATLYAGSLKGFLLPVTV